ncbi:MAG: hypothetical protein EZS28_001183 [Streblomastix strix]|uniref:Uncharacterized protein n=1 Tax=Streblomastix strix TaxID=222440 RepID=A0A5J4X7T3_9EUKA|nr:MAG: hypothetical protein EZS28_001183 [Streblomastix strix]
MLLIPSSAVIPNIQLILESQQWKNQMNQIVEIEQKCIFPVMMKKKEFMIKKEMKLKIELEIHMKTSWEQETSLYVLH